MTILKLLLTTEQAQLVLFQKERMITFKKSFVLYYTTADQVMTAKDRQ